MPQRCLRAATALVAKGAGVNVRNSDGFGPLHAACDKGHVDIVRLLLGKGALIDAADADAETPLHRAAMEGHVEVCSLLRGADARRRRKGGMTALSIALIEGRTTVIPCLVTELGANVDDADDEGFAPIHSAAEHGKLDAARALRSLGANLNAATLSGVTPLILAARKGDLEFCSFLLEGDAPASTAPKEDDGSDALNEAARCGQTAICRLLVAQGAELETRDLAGMTPLMRSCDRGKKETALYLAEAGASVNARNPKSGATPLLLAAAQKDDASLIEGLIEKGAKVEMADNKGLTPLMTSCWRCCKDAAEVLVAHGADINVADKDGWTCFHYAVLGGSVGLCEWLFSKGANPRAKDVDGVTPLYVAASHGSVDVCKLLLDSCGAEEDLFAKTSGGKSALDGARETVFSGETDGKIKQRQMTTCLFLEERMKALRGDDEATSAGASPASGIDSSEEAAAPAKEERAE